MTGTGISSPPTAWWRRCSKASPARLLGQPFNILRLAFHPEGLAPRTVNLAEWSAHLLERLHRQCEATADPELLRLYQELKAYRMPARRYATIGRQRRDPLQAAAQG